MRRARPRSCTTYFDRIDALSLPRAARGAGGAYQLGVFRNKEKTASVRRGSDGYRQNSLHALRRCTRSGKRFWRAHILSHSQGKHKARSVSCRSRTFRRGTYNAHHRALLARAMLYKPDSRCSGRQRKSILSSRGVSVCRRIL